jgi:hypothetical protein
MTIKKEKVAIVAVMERKERLRACGRVKHLTLWEFRRGEKKIIWETEETRL